ncbi:selenide, water dikinase SelD [Ornithinicoccus hortensis]|uniref:Selenide, water dikinase n=1 Tax=Ornithinicoccus hortensis TaxID=82346 RepID=A0A542YQC4_9MICO|nr:selenide, water dikinase SelD [Ornithinicoccus hortensis]TQL50303.1 selenophosphate synthase [Ornithinicoccus hortensis]
MSHQGAGRVRLTEYAAGGGCACKIPPGELETLVAGLPVAAAGPDVLVGTETGDDGGVVLVRPDLAVIATADFFTPVVDDPYDFGRVAATNALSDIYAMGGTPVMAINLVGWPRGTLGTDVLAEVLRGGAEVAALAGCPLVGGHSIDDPEPKYGLAVTGTADPARLLRNDAATAGLPLTLTKPLGIGVLNTWHKRTGERSAEAITAMTELNAAAAAAATDAGLAAATDITGFGLLGHLHKMMRASGVSARIDAGSVPYLPGARDVASDGHVSGGTRRNLDWVSPSLDADGVGELDLLLLADAQTSGGLLLVGEVDLPGAVVVGEVLPPRADGVTVQVRP